MVPHHSSTTLDYSSFFLDLDRLEYYEDMASESQATPDQLSETQDARMEPGLPSDLRTEGGVLEGGALDADALVHERLHTPDLPQQLDRLRNEGEPRSLCELRPSFRKMIDDNRFYTHGETSCSGVLPTVPDCDRYFQVSREAFNSD